MVHYIRKSNLVDRSTLDLEHHPDVKTIFPDPRAEGVRYYRKTRIYPINHGMVIRREIAEKHPWAVLNLLKAFEAARRDRQSSSAWSMSSITSPAGAIPPTPSKALREPVLRHGVKANRHILEAAAQYSVEQGLTPRLMKLEEVFARSTMDQ